MKKLTLSIIIICLLAVGCSPLVVVEQDYFVSSILKDECLVSTYLRVYHYNSPFDSTTEQSTHTRVKCQDVEKEMSTQYDIIGDNKIKLENKFK